MKSFAEYRQLAEALCPKCGMDPCQCGEVVDEDVEQIDELSKTTLASYKTAAHKSISAAAVDRHAGKMSSKDYHQNQNKRSAGIKRADAPGRLDTYADKTPKKLDISANGKQIQKQYHEETERTPLKSFAAFAQKTN